MSFTTYDHRWHLKMVAPFLASGMGHDHNQGQYCVAGLCKPDRPTAWAKIGMNRSNCSAADFKFLKKLPKIIEAKF